jgi:importin subunit beta-1
MALSSPSRDVGKAAAQVIAKVASVDLPRSEWRDLEGTLRANVMSPEAHVREASLRALGFVCEEVAALTEEGKEVEIDANSVLTAVVQGMQKAEPSDAVRLAATQALLNALGFVEANFKNDDERNFIMTVVCECAVNQVSANRVAALECAVRIVELYYEKMVAYMPALFHITIEAIKGDDQPVAMQAIEFWTVIADQEYELIDQAANAEEGEEQPQNFNFTLGVRPHLLPVLLDCLLKQEDEEPDDDAWDIAAAAATCMASMTLTVGDEMVQPIMMFVEKSVQSQDWRAREAAITAFGVILEGPSEEVIVPLVRQGIPFLIQRMADPHLYVKDTAVWALARICELYSAEVTGPQYPAVMTALMEATNGTAKMATSACWGFYRIFECFDDGEPHPTNILTANMQDIVMRLLMLAERPDASAGKLRNSAYETLNSLIRAAAVDSFPVIAKLVDYTIDRFNRIFQMGQAQQRGGREDLAQTQADLASVIQMLAQRLGRALEPQAGTIMTIFMAIFKEGVSVAHEETLQAVGALAKALGTGFAPYLQAFMEVLCGALQNATSFQVCTIATGVVVDLCHNGLGKALVPYCDTVVGILLSNLKNPLLHQDARAPHIGCFGDIALAIEGHFDKYLQTVMTMLAAAAATQVDSPDQYDYLISLQIAILETYTSILHGLEADKKQALFMPYAQSVVQFIGFVYKERERDEELTCVACGLLGDLAKVLGHNVKPIFQQSTFIGAFIQECRQSHTDRIKQIGQWVYKTMNQ